MLEPSATESILVEVKPVPCEAQVFDDVGDNAARHVARMRGKGDEPVGVERIGVVPVTARRAEQFATQFFEPTLKLAAVP